MNVVSSHPSPRRIDKLRAEHQAQATLAAKSGLVPRAFLGDPTFVELVSSKDKPWPGPEPSASSKAKNDESANNSG